MKKLSDELQKSYYILIFIFSLSVLGLLYIFAAYMIHNASSDIITVNTFINYEMQDLEEDLNNGVPIDEIFYEALDESPKIEDIFIIFEHDGKLYFNNDAYPKNLSENKMIDENIQNIGFYDYQLIHRVIDTNNLTSPIELTIIKDLRNDKKLFFKAMGIISTWVVLTLGMGIFISRKFYNKFIPPLRNIQEITNKINLDSIDSEIDPEVSFIEFVSIVRSYQDMLRRLKKQTDAQIDFVNSASHELKTPIFIIGGYVDLIKRWGAGDKNILKESLDSIEDETKNMASLVSKLLFLAKDNREGLECKEIDLAEIIDDIISHLRVVYPEQIIEFSAESLKIYSDTALVKQLFVNLIENAVKYGDNNPINVSLTMNQNITVTIEDHGIGISKENLEHIFERFFRVDKARSRNMGSHGLGLSIVKNIIEALHGDLEIKSELGEGTTVHVTLPYSLK